MARKSKRDQVLSLNKLANKYPGSGIASTIDILPEDQLWLPSRCIPLTYAMGGGIPYGRVLEIFGEESSGKTLIAQDFGAVCQSMGGEILWDDAEQAFTTKWAELNGLDPTRIHLYKSTSVEWVSDWLADTAIAIRSRLTNNEPIVFIQDSIAALDCEANINGSQVDSKAEMGNRAKAIYKMVRIRNEMLSELGVISIYINQIRKKLGASQWEDPDCTTGGAAMKFFASQRLGIYAGKMIKDKIGTFEERVGHESSIRLKKNKVAPPRSTFKARIYFNQAYEKPIGLDRYYGLGELLVKLQVVEKQGNSPMIRFKGELVGRSMESFEKRLMKDDELRKKLILRSRINTPSRLRSKLEDISDNRYPVKITKVLSQLNDNEDE